MASRVGIRLALGIVVVFAGAAGLLAPGAHLLADTDLTMLLRFMAALKAAVAIGAFALVEWRLRAPASGRLAAGLIASVALMATASGLIWSLDHVAAGAALFHLGLLAFLVLSWRDGIVQQLPARIAHHHRLTYGPATGTATSFLRRNGSVQGGS